MRGPVCVCVLYWAERGEEELKKSEGKIKEEQGREREGKGRGSTNR